MFILSAPFYVPRFTQTQAVLTFRRVCILQESRRQEQLDLKLILPETSPAAFVYNPNSIICVPGTVDFVNSFRRLIRRLVVLGPGKRGRRDCVIPCCPSVVKRSNTVARRTDTRNVSEYFRKYLSVSRAQYVCPQQMLRAWQTSQHLGNILTSALLPP